VLALITFRFVSNCCREYEAAALLMRGIGEVSV